MRIIETKVYTINEHPMKSLCFDWMRENLHDLNQYSAQEVTDSIEALSEAIGGTNDYLSRASFTRTNKSILYHLLLKTISVARHRAVGLLSSRTTLSRL